MKGNNLLPKKDETKENNPLFKKLDKIEKNQKIIIDKFNKLLKTRYIKYSDGNDLKTDYKKTRTEIVQIDELIDKYNNSVFNMIKCLEKSGFDKFIVVDSVYNILVYKFNYKEFDKIFEEFTVYVEEFIISVRNLLNYDKFEEYFVRISDGVNLSILDLFDFTPKAYLSELSNCKLSNILCNVKLFKLFNEKIISILTKRRNK